MGLEYSIETLNLNVSRKRNSAYSSRRNSSSAVNNYEMVNNSTQSGLDYGASQPSIVATVLDSVIIGKTAPGELTMIGCAVNLVKAAWGSALLTLPRTAWFMGWAGTVSKSALKLKNKVLIIHEKCIEK